MTTKVALFCGGRGSATIIREFLRMPEVELALLVNAYDDGLSTGALRDFIPGMLGPSDFRKNFSYLLDPHSKNQYALKTLIEYRLPMTFSADAAARIRDFAETGARDGIDPKIGELLAALDPRTTVEVRGLLKQFFDYAATGGRSFDFRDCALGNLLFAGAYLRQGRNFNAAGEAMSRLVSSRAVLVNVSNGENRILMALKADGALLAHEAEIVGPQSPAPITGLYFLPQQIPAEELMTLDGLSLERKREWLAERDSPPQLSEEARRFLRDADAIVYGPGTQHSSLLPSYRIAAPALKSSRARIKALIVNLAPDHDIQNFTASGLADVMLEYAGDPENEARIVTHILIQHPRRRGSGPSLDPGALEGRTAWRGAIVVPGSFRNEILPQVHNGRAVAGAVVNLLEHDGAREQRPSLEIFYDLAQRPAAGPALVEEFLEFDWCEHFRRVVLRVHGAELPELPPLPDHLAIERWGDAGGRFPEIGIAADWLRAGGADYLATITGDGEYRLRDIAFGVKVLEQSSFGAVYGSRTQSRRQFRHSLRSVYGEKGLAYFASFAGAFLLSVAFAAGFGVIFSDPLTGFRIYRRRRMAGIEQALGRARRSATPTTITRMLVRNHVEIAELPVQYRTFAGFTDPRTRLKRGMSNLLGLLR
jgi:2-phospho-L-lactate transferase/gluconeogenesis factor (CofD/UPF0052 family)